MLPVSVVGWGGVWWRGGMCVCVLCVGGRGGDSPTPPAAAAARACPAGPALWSLLAHKAGCPQVVPRPPCAYSHLCSQAMRTPTSIPATRGGPHPLPGARTARGGGSDNRGWDQGTRGTGTRAPVGEDAATHAPGAGACSQGRGCLFPLVWLERMHQRSRHAAQWVGSMPGDPRSQGRRGLVDVVAGT